MHRLSAFALVASVALALSAGAARAECIEGILVCVSPCSELGINTKKSGCVPRCRRSIICEFEPDQTARSSLPQAALPADLLPKSRLPASHMPDSSLP